MVILNPDHYPLLEQAVSYLETHYREQPRLETVAKAVGVSPSHFQKLFREGVGISPKRFLQFTTLKHARPLLKQNHNLLRTSLDVGLSGPGRLHDLFVECEAMTPGDYKNRGRGLRLKYGLHTTPFGEALLVISPKGIVEFAFLPDRRHKGLSIVDYLKAKWPAAQISKSRQRTQSIADQIFSPHRHGQLLLHLQGTNFQIQVWQALLQIPPGQLIRYQDICEYLGQPGAARAVGSAVGQNPISYLIPCHRVLRSDGGIGGYAGGTPRKRIMLALEAIN